MDLWFLKHKRFVVSASEGWDRKFNVIIGDVASLHAGELAQVLRNIRDVFWVEQMVAVEKEMIALGEPDVGVDYVVIWQSIEIVQNLLKVSKILIQFIFSYFI